MIIGQFEHKPCSDPINLYIQTLDHIFQDCEAPFNLLLVVLLVNDIYKVVLVVNNIYKLVVLLVNSETFLIKV